MTLSAASSNRAAWMRLLALATAEELADARNALPATISFVPLRPAETGLAMVRGRAGGTGMAFNLGEMTVTRCALRLHGGQIGVSYLSGRDAGRAETAALFDGLLQGGEVAHVTDALLRRISSRLATNAERRAREADATRVEFFTMVREQSNA